VRDFHIPSLLSVFRFLSLIIVSLLSACSSATDNLQRFDVSGKVTLDGKPAPRGEIFFQPDSKQGNTGPGAVAKIIDGTYRTRPGKGVTSGPHLARVVVFDGVASEDSPDGRSLMTDAYTVSVNIQGHDLIHNFQIPSNLTSAPHE